MTNDTSILRNLNHGRREGSTYCQRKLRYVMLGLLVVAGIALADSIGVYECDYCNPSNPFDENTQQFIANVVNQDIGDWEAGDHVLIVNPSTGEEGVWGRASAFGPRHYMGPAGSWGYVPVPGGGSGDWHWTDPCGFLEVCGDLMPY